MLLKQCYDQISLSCNEAAFVSDVPYLCECYRTSLFHLTQEEIYEVVVKSFKANPKCANLSWKSTQAIHDANLPKDLVNYYP